MPYSPPTSPLNVSWTGATAYGGAKGKVRASWASETTQYVYEPASVAPGAAGSPSARLGQFYAAAPGIAPGGFGATRLLTATLWYASPQFVVSASWVGAVPYAAPRAVLSPTFNRFTTLVAPGGVAPGAAGSPTVIKQQFAVPAGISAGVFGTATYVLRPYEYKPPQWVINANWFNAQAYTRPSGTINAAFQPPSPATTLAAFGWDSAAFGTQAVRLQAIQLLPAGIAPTLAFGSSTVFLKQRFLRPGGIDSGAFGTASVLNRFRRLQPLGFTGAVGAHTVADPRAAQTVRPSGFVATSYGATAVSPQIVFAIGFLGQVGVPGVTRNPSPLGIDSAAYGTPLVEYRTKTLAVGGIAPGVAGQPDVSDRTQRVFNAGIIDTALVGEQLVQNRAVVLAPDGFESFFSPGYSFVDNKNRALLPAAIPPAPYATDSTSKALYALSYTDERGTIMASLAGDNTWTRYVPTVATVDFDGGGIDATYEFASIAASGSYIAYTHKRTMRVYDRLTGEWIATVQRTVGSDAPPAQPELVLFTDKFGNSSTTTVATTGDDAGTVAAVDGGFALLTGPAITVWRPGRVFAAVAGAQAVGSGSFVVGASSTPGLLLASEISSSADTITPVRLFDGSYTGAQRAAVSGSSLYFYGTRSGATGLYKIDLSTGNVASFISEAALAAGWAGAALPYGPAVLAAGGKIFVYSLTAVRVFDAALTELRAVQLTGINTGLPTAWANELNGYVAFGARTERYYGGDPNNSLPSLVIDNTAVVRVSDGRVVRRPAGVNPPTAWPYVQNDAAQAIAAGIDSLQMGRASETGVGERNRHLYLLGFETAAYGTASLKRTPSFEPAGIAPPAFGDTLVAPRIRTIFAAGRAFGDYGQPILWDRVRYVRDAGQQDLSLYGTPAVDHLNREIKDITGIAPGPFGVQTAWFKRRALAVTGIGFEVGKQFGGTKVQDARQYVTGAGAGAAGVFGLSSIARNERFLRPEGIAGEVGAPAVDWRTRYLRARGGEHSELGTPALRNNTQIVTGYSPAAFDDYGQPEIFNRNRTIRAYGVDTSKLTSGALVENKARVLYAPSIAPLPFAPALVADRLRRVTTLGHEDSLFPSWTLIYNSMRRLEPSGVPRGQAGVPRVWDNTQRIDTADGGVDTSLWGTPFVAFKIRTLDADRFGVQAPRWPEPYIGLYSRPLTPPSITGDMGMPTVEHTRNLIRVIGQDMARYGDGAAVRNKTPQLYVGSLEAPTNPQRPYVGFRVRPVQAQGFSEAVIGRTVVDRRTRYLTPNGVLAVRFGLQTVAFDAPQIPPQQLVQPGGFSSASVSAPDMNRRSLIAEGIAATRFGTAVLTTNVIEARGIDPVYARQFGEGTAVIGPQFITVQEGVQPPPEQFPKPILWPYVLRISEDSLGATVLPQALMDYPFQDQRPLFGTAAVTLKNRTIQQGHSSPQFGAQGEPTVTLKKRTLAPRGIAPGRFGYPDMPAGWEIKPFWGRTSEYDAPETNYPTTDFGDTTVGHVPVYDPNVRPQGLDATLWGDSNVELFIRVVRAQGSNTATFGQQWVHPPIRLYPQSFAEQWGTAWVSDRVRSVAPDGLDATGWGYEAGSWVFQSTTVRIVNRVTPPTITTPPSTGHVLTNADLACIATLGDTAAFGKPRLGACAC